LLELFFCNSNDASIDGGSTQDLVYVAVVSGMGKFVSVGLKDTAVISILLHVNLQNFVTLHQLSPLCHTIAQNNQHSMKNPFVFTISP